MIVFVTGAAGYVGTVLVPMLLRAGHRVIAYDNLLYGQIVFQDLCREDGFRFVRGDVRDLKHLNAAAADADVLIHLAAIVGAPACHTDPERAEAVNVGGTQNVVSIAHGRPILFPSTGSCYGSVEGGVCTEDTPISPVSEYGAQKAAAEKIVRRSDHPWAVFRFATAFGASPRPRLDLLPNTFVYKALTERSLVIYEADFMRTLIHVQDIARVFAWAVGGKNGGAQDVGPAMAWDPLRRAQVFNIGHPEMNLTKGDLAKKIVARVPGCILNLAGEGKDPDVRNYKVDYSRMLDAGFEPEVGIDEGLDELFRAFQIVRVAPAHANA